MICRRCLYLRLHPSCSYTPKISKDHCNRLLSTSQNHLKPESPPAATSTSAAQPFSTPFTPAPSQSPDPTTTPKQSTPSLPKSSLLAGTPLKGLGYLKNQEPPVAKEDNEYPNWLWGLLDDKKSGSKGGEEGGGEGDLFCKSGRHTVLDFSGSCRDFCWHRKLLSV